MAAEREITLTLTKTLALAKIADDGLRVNEALGLIQNTSAAERAINKLRAALPS